jgi:glyoxylase-like metal-dependent hydrolase (beta-lactamase superfamily II)
MSRPPYTFEVVPGVWCVLRRSYFTCSYLCATADGRLVAVDAGMKSSGSEMLAGLAELGRSPRDVRAVLLTHWHNDHAAGAAELARLAGGADVYYSSAEAGHLTRAVAAGGLRGRLSAAIPETGPLVLFKGLLGNAPQQAVEATRTAADGDRIVDGEFDVLATPGHTAGHLSYYHRPTRTLFAGDAVAVIGGRLRFMARPVTEDLAAARASMLKCLDRPIVAVCPGHREPLAAGVEPERQRMRAHLLAGGRWPLLG